MRSFSEKARERSSFDVSHPQGNIDAWIDCSADVNVAVPWLWSAIGYSEYNKADVDKAKVCNSSCAPLVSVAAASPPPQQSPFQ